MSSRLDIPSATDQCLRPDELRVTMMAITHTGMSRRRSAMESDSSDSSDSASECASVASDTAPTDLTDLSSPPPFYGECSGTGDRSRLQRMRDCYPLILHPCAVGGASPSCAVARQSMPPPPSAPVLPVFRTTPAGLPRTNTGAGCFLQASGSRSPSYRTTPSLTLTLSPRRHSLRPQQHQQPLLEPSP